MTIYGLEPSASQEAASQEKPISNKCKLSIKKSDGIFIFQKRRLPSVEVVFKPLQFETIIHLQPLRLHLQSQGLSVFHSFYFYQKIIDVNISVRPMRINCVTDLPNAIPNASVKSSVVFFGFLFQTNPIENAITKQTQ